MDEEPEIGQLHITGRHTAGNVSVAINGGKTEFDRLRTLGASANEQ
ncbi:MAG: hypothetical protein OEW68_08095 [Gammaproteobacteria bacterium]|nr:hypothetical protein [Gammaproteobacteria bacterium]MDH4314787.1 hypothetical protein [Gammaproteobacteria bacterium]MDH5214772.1 hypothetical protein [Gammaproteobacteria bacterium]